MSKHQSEHQVGGVIKSDSCRVGFAARAEGQRRAITLQDSIPLCVKQKSAIDNL